ncbi:MAG: helix-turn-helix domain-containing protein [Pseudomonadota bacterium]
MILALDGLMDSSLAITLDTLKTAAGFLSRGVRNDRVRVLTAGHRREVRTGAGLRLRCDLSFKQVLDQGLRPDWVMLPGAGISSESELTARLAQADACALLPLLRALAGAGANISASCSSVFLLAQSGLLAGRSATTTWWLARLFRARHPDIALDETRMLVRDGPCLTAGAAFSQLDVVLAVVAATMGAAVAQLCARYMLIDSRPSQALYMIASHRQHADPTVVAAERWIDQHLALSAGVAELAGALALSSKTLGRRIQAAAGVSPIKFIQRRKLLHAVHLIETSALSIDAIAAQIGYQDATALRKLVKREFGTTPGALR